MKILILGASSKTSVGYTVGEILRQGGHAVRYASRTSRIDLTCDVTDPRELEHAFREASPEVVIHAAGVFGRAQKLGSIRRVAVEDHLLAKSLGTLLVLNAAEAAGTVHSVIAFGGREISSNPGYVVYTIANGAMWSALQFANRHTKLRCYFLELPLVEGSKMASQYLADPSTAKPEPGTTATPTGIAEKVEEILAGEHNPTRRVLINERWTA